MARYLNRARRWQQYPGIETSAVWSFTQSALYLAALQHPDLIITDIGLPDMNGIDLIAKLRRLNNGHPNVPIVAVTGYGDEAARDALSAGACRALIKPLDLDSLLDAVNNLMGTAQSGARDAGRGSQGIRP